MVYVQCYFIFSYRCVYLLTVNYLILYWLSNITYFIWLSFILWMLVYFNQSSVYHFILLSSILFLFHVVFHLSTYIIFYISISNHSYGYLYLNIITITIYIYPVYVYILYLLRLRSFIYLINPYVYLITLSCLDTNSWEL